MVKKISFIHLHFVFFFIIGMCCLSGCVDEKKNIGTEKNLNLERAQVLLDSLYKNYSVPNSFLLRGTYPFKEISEDTYAESRGQRKNIPKQYSYLWPYTGTFSAVNALFDSSHNEKYYELLKNRVLVGLEEYFDTQRIPAGYASYIISKSLSDRYYDDNTWLGLEFANLYGSTKDKVYLTQAKLIWDFVISGMDCELGGGTYWCEQKKFSKNTCSNAPVSVLAFKLFEATQDSTYFHKGQELYDWTKKNLQDKSDYLYYDRLNMDGRIGPAKHAYNSGQMMQSAALQYKLTKKKEYLTDAQNIAKSCYNYFFTDYMTSNGETFRLLKKGDVWFSAVMLRGYLELYHQDNNDIYINAYQKNLSYAWNHARNENGLFEVDFSGKEKNTPKYLLAQAAIVEMYARLGALNKK